MLIAYCTSTCGRCGAPIRFTRVGSKYITLDPDGGRHAETCTKKRPSKAVVVEGVQMRLLMPQGAKDA